MNIRPRPDRSEFGGLDLSDYEPEALRWRVALWIAGGLVALSVFYGLGRLLLAVL